MKTILSLLAPVFLLSNAWAATTVVTAAGGAPSAEGWTVTTGGTGPAGDFSGDPNSNTGGGAASVVAGPPAWGIFAAPGSSITADFALPLIGPGGFVSIVLDNSSVAPGVSVGVQFFSGGPGGTLAFEYLFTGGPAVYNYGDASGFGNPTTTPFTADGLMLTLRNLGGGTYSFDDGVSPTLFGGFIGAVPTIDTIRVADFGNNFSAGDDLFFNTLSYDPVPEPAGMVLLLVSAMGLTVWRRRSRWV